MKRVLATVWVCGLIVGWAGWVFAQGERPGERFPGPGGPPPNPLARLFDADRDGTLSAEEITAAAEKLRQFDKDQDGKLSDEELRAAMPFGPARPPFEPGGMPGGPRGQVGRATSFDAPVLPKDDAEKRILDAILQAQRGPRFANVPVTDGRLLRLLTEAVGAKNVVEIGTSTGESGMWFAMALRTTGGHLYTHEIDPGRAKTAEENFGRAGVDELVTVILGDAHETVKQHKDPIDILFLDADKEGYIDYLEKLLPLVRPGGLIIAHNMNPRQADARYVEAITKNPALETSFLLMEGAGVGVTLKKR